MKKLIAVVLILVGLAVAGYVVAQTFNNTPVNNTVVNETVSTDEEMGTGLPPEGFPENEKYGIPKWWCWKRIYWPKFQEYANETDIIWEYDKTGKKIGGKVMVADEPLMKEYSSGLGEDTDEENGFYGFCSISPVKYLEGERKGNCGGVSIIFYCLFSVKGEDVVLTSAQTINSKTGVLGLGHAWVEWTDSENNQWVIDNNRVIPLNEWYQGDWTHSWVQWKPGVWDYEIDRNGNRTYYNDYTNSQYYHERYKEINK